MVFSFEAFRLQFCIHIISPMRAKSTPSHPTSLRFILILSFRLWLDLLHGLFLWGFSTTVLYPYHFLYVCYMPRPCYFSECDNCNSVSWRVQTTKLLFMVCLLILLSKYNQYYSFRKRGQACYFYKTVRRIIIFYFPISKSFFFSKKRPGLFFFFFSGEFYP